MDHQRDKSTLHGRKHSIVFYLAILFLLSVSPLVSAQQPPPQNLRELPNQLLYDPEQIFVDYSTSRFDDYQGNELAFDRSVGLVAVPLTDRPWDNVDDVAPGSGAHDIGAIYLPAGSTRLQLPPGVYRVQVRRDADTSWTALFFDQDNSLMVTHVAKVWVVESTGNPLAFVDYSICYSFNRTLICI